MNSRFVEKDHYCNYRQTMVYRIWRVDLFFESSKPLTNGHGRTKACLWGGNSSVQCWLTGQKSRSRKLKMINISIFYDWLLHLETGRNSNSKRYGLGRFPCCRFFGKFSNSAWVKNLYWEYPENMVVSKRFEWVEMEKRFGHEALWNR